MSKKNEAKKRSRVKIKDLKPRKEGEGIKGGRCITKPLDKASPK